MAPAALAWRRALARLWRLRARARAWATKDRGLRVAFLAPLELVHVGLFVWGLCGGDGAVPDVGIVVGYVLLVVTVVVLIDVQAFWRRERYFFVAAARECVLATCAIYIDSVATYMVAVTNEQRSHNIRLQDNVQHALQALFDGHRNLLFVFLALPEMVAGEAILLCGSLAVAVATSRLEERRSVLAVLARGAKVMRCCRLLRVACYVSTVMPSQTIDCFANRYDETYNLREHFREAVTHWRVGGGCNDLIFSGHGVVLSLCVLLSRDYARDAGASTLLPLWLACRLGHAALRIIYARMHMAVDLVVSLTVTFLVWNAVPLPGLQGEVLRGVAPAGGVPPLPAEEADEETPAEGTAATTAVALLDARARTAVRRWAAITVGTALAGFGLLVVNANEAGPISEFNVQRLRRIVPSSPPVPAPRLFCAMLHIETSPSARSAYAAAVSHTWGRRCDGLLLWDERRADIAPLDLAAARLEPGDATQPSDRWLRVRRMLRHIAGSALGRFDWFLVVDDGGFVFPGNFLLGVQALAASSHEGIAKPLHLLGGWGFALNDAALAELLRAMDEGETAAGACPAPSAASARQGGLAQHSVERCLAARGLDAVPWDKNPAVHAALGCEAGADEVVLNLKAVSTHGCRHAVLAYMIPTPGWMYGIDSAVYPSGQ